MLYHIIERIQNNDKNAMMEMLDRFQPLLRKYARMLKVEDAYEILVTDFLEMLCKIKLSNLRSSEDGVLVCYIRSSVYHSYIRHSQKNSCLELNEICLSELSEAQQIRVEEISAVNDEYDDIGHSQLHEVLSEYEMKVLWWICVDKYSAAEIAKRLGVSRQSVNQTKQRAIKKTKKHYAQFDQNINSAIHNPCESKSPLLSHGT